MCDRAASSCEFGQDSCAPLEISNGIMLVNACVYALYSFVLLGDARCTVKQILRGLAPAHVMTGFLLILLSTVLAVSLFAGREFAGATEGPLYEIVESAAIGLWIITAIVCLIGHSRWRSRREANQQEGRRSSVGPASFGPDSTDGGLQLGELGFL